MKSYPAHLCARNWNGAPPDFLATSPPLSADSASGGGLHGGGGNSSHVRRQAVFFLSGADDIIPYFSFIIDTNRLF